MLKFKKISQINGLDTTNISNARQNSYSWSMTELGDYIYVGTSRNMLTTASFSFGSSGSQNSISVPHH